MQRGYIRFNNDTKTVGGTTTPLTSADFGVYLSGTGTYNAPSRDVSYIAIPGRSQDIVHDNGRFNNVTITYPCFIYSNSQSDFNTKLSNFRNYVKKFVGWTKLQDSYHPDEYRMVNPDAEFTVDVTPDHRAGEFQLTLTAQPFRFTVLGSEINITDTSATLNHPLSSGINNSTNFTSEADFYFASINANGTIVLDNPLATVTNTITGGSGTKCYKFDSTTGLWLEPSSYNSQLAYDKQTYDTISNSVAMSIDYKTRETNFLPTVLYGFTLYTVTVTSTTIQGGSINFWAYCPHWRKL